MGEKINLGDYESRDYHFSLSIDVEPGQTIEEVKKEVTTVVKRWVKEEAKNARAGKKPKWDPVRHVDFWNQNDKQEARWSCRTATLFKRDGLRAWALICTNGKVRKMDSLPVIYVIECESCEKAVFYQVEISRIMCPCGETGKGKAKYIPFHEAPTKMQSAALRDFKKALDNKQHRVCDD